MAKFRKGQKVIYSNSEVTIVSKIRGHDAYKVRHGREVFNVLERHLKKA